MITKFVGVCSLGLLTVRHTLQIATMRHRTKTKEQCYCRMSSAPRTSTLTNHSSFAQGISFSTSYASIKSLLTLPSARTSLAISQPKTDGRILTLLTIYSISPPILPHSQKPARYPNKPPLHNFHSHPPNRIRPLSIQPQTPVPPTHKLNTGDKLRIQPCCAGAAGTENAGSC